MFTGLIQTIGKIERYSNGQLTISCPEIRSNLAIGDSVAVNGVCLTVAEILARGFIADVSPETLSRSNLGAGNLPPVNLEMALAVGDRLGGHFVTGHIDGVGALCESKMTGGAWEISFSAPEELGRYIISKGSIAINGISLTVAQCNGLGTWFSTAVIPHTYDSTNLKYLQIGSSVNLEADMLGKYVEKFMKSDRQNQRQQSAITSDFLAEHGWN
ncbi:riboflavin synthase alpha chain [Synechococcus sp. PCC 7502]|uniref:riboflavin synthase n=1 Tax=Synechococcus sp. PCC 7502 TaxID=1173263 RepID=UPI00029FF1CD|nr:riboflavin synthase [Synechococcus sp. PCC 7502]AFY74470.1 riboflavin synthase alpha chain [Synechococcus sp. PCC 7502]